MSLSGLMLTSGELGQPTPRLQAQVGNAVLRDIGHKNAFRDPVFRGNLDASLTAAMTVINFSSPFWRAKAAQKIWRGVTPQNIREHYSR
jgi:hypothetical protein